VRLMVAARSAFKLGRIDGLLFLSAPFSAEPGGELCKKGYDQLGNFCCCPPILITESAMCKGPTSHRANCKLGE